MCILAGKHIHTSKLMYCSVPEHCSMYRPRDSKFNHSYQACDTHYLEKGKKYLILEQDRKFFITKQSVLLSIKYMIPMGSK